MHHRLHIRLEIGGLAESQRLQGRPDLDPGPQIGHHVAHNQHSGDTMHRTLKKLYRDHAHFNRLMDMLETELEGLGRTGEPVSPLLTELVAYVGDYVDAFHHPIEDQLYQMMLARSDSGQEQMDHLLGDHLVITNITRELRKALADPSKREEAHSIGMDLVGQQRAHIVFEETSAFPLLRDELNQEDFDNAARAIPAIEDPLMDVNMQERYPALFAHLQKET